MKKIVPCLWFAENGEEAANFYISLFKNSKIKDKTYYGKNMHLPEGTLLTVTLELFGQEFMLLNGGPLDPFNHSVSFMVPCESQAEIDEIWDKILKNGGEPEQCGWIRDKFGLCWQVYPAVMDQFMLDKNKEKVNAVMQEMMTMIKLDVKKLEDAYKKAA
jgi:predicted 3-demethylubiquinone-9 3-methyltransferase (glyoxalase superfamily)